MEVELVACPFSAEHDLLLVVVNDEARDAVHASIVPWNHDQWSMGESQAVIRIIGVAASDDFEGGFLEGDVADVDGVDLSDGGDGHGDRYAGRVS